MRGRWLGAVQVLAKIRQLLKVGLEPTLLWGGPFSSEGKGPCPSAGYGRGCHQRRKGENATPALHFTLLLFPLCCVLFPCQQEPLGPAGAWPAI